MDDEGYPEEAWGIGSVAQLTSHPPRKVPKKEPIGFKLIPSKRHEPKENDDGRN